MNDSLMTQENTDAAENVETTTRKPKVHRWIVGEDGVNRDFGARSKIVTNVKTSEADNQILITFAFENGAVVVFNFRPETPVENFLLQVLAEGFVSKAKGSIAGVDGTEQLIKVIQEKISQFQNKHWAVRSQGGISKPKDVSLNKTQIVWARLNGYAKDLSLLPVEALIEIKEKFSELSDEQVKELKTSKAFIRENALLTSEIALAAVEALDQE